MSTESRKAFEEARDYFSDHSETTAQKKEDFITVKGQAFIQTLDNETMKLAAMRVYAFPLDSLKEFTDPNEPIHLPKPLAASVTNADGEFILKIESDHPYFIYAGGDYKTRRGQLIVFLWHIPEEKITDLSTLMLMNDNARFGLHFPVVIEGQDNL